MKYDPLEGAILSILSRSALSRWSSIAPMLSSSCRMLDARAQAMVNAANANPGYDPTTGAVLAVICFPQDDVHAQDSIIELGQLCGLSPGYWKHNVKVYMGGPGSYSGSPSHETDESMEGYATTILGAGYGSIPAGVNTPSEFLEWVNMRFQNNAYKKGSPSWLELANWFNAAAGRMPYTE